LTDSNINSVLGIVIIIIIKIIIIQRCARQYFANSILFRKLKQLHCFVFSKYYADCILFNLCQNLSQIY